MCVCSEVPSNRLVWMGNNLGAVLAKCGTVRCLLPKQSLLYAIQSHKTMKAASWQDGKVCLEISKTTNVNRFTWEINYMQTQTCSMFQPVCTNATQVLSRPYKVYALIHSLTVWMWLDVAGICWCPFPKEQQTCWISKVHRAWGIQQITGWDQHLAEKKIVDSSKVNHFYYLYLYYIYV